VSSVPDVKITADPQKFRQVMQNYIENSIKYTPSGWVKVSIDADPTDPKYVIISVVDSGLGKSKELIPELFQQFSRDKQNSLKILGTGLGLFIAKTIVEGHGGKTWAESDGEGKGSRFYVRMARA
jgi:signal transduction histidine kinase